MRYTARRCTERDNDSFFHVVGMFSDSHKISCEARLMLAVLEDAIGAFQKYALPVTTDGLEKFREAHQWIYIDDHDWLFSFVNICSVLGLTPEYIREGLQRWHKKKTQPLILAESSFEDTS